MNLFTISDSKIHIHIWILESDIVNRFWLIHDEDWTFTSMDTKIGSPTFHTWGLKSIH